MKIETNLKRELETKIRNVRSRINEATNFKFSSHIQDCLEEYLDFLEDFEAGRLEGSETEAMLRERFEESLMMEVPIDYKISLLPFWYNYTDTDKIAASVTNLANEFLSESKPMQVLFAVFVKVYAF